MVSNLLALSFPEWQPHFSFLGGAAANEMIVLRWLHLIFDEKVRSQDADQNLS